MTSFIQVNRVCEHCEKEFLAKTTMTRFCSTYCKSRSYKDAKLGIKPKKGPLNSRQMVEKLELLKAKEFLKVKEVAELLGCSSRTVYYYIDQGAIEIMNFGQRMTRVKRASLDKLIGLKEAAAKAKENPKRIYTLEECVSTFDIRKKFGISESALRDMIIRHDIPKMKKGSFAYVPKEEIEKYLGVQF